MVRFCSILACGFLVLVTPSMAVAQTGKTTIERQMNAQGYEVIFSETTWLGRLRILAVRGDVLREIVIGPGTGEILRDVAYEIPGLAQQIALAQRGESGQNSVDLADLLGNGRIDMGPQDPVAAGVSVPPAVGATDVAPSVGSGAAPAVGSGAPPAADSGDE